MLTPFLRPNLDLLFVGFNPHPYSWERGRYYAHGSLWRILRKSGLAPDIQDDSQLFDYNFGITDLVHDRPTREAKEISDAEYTQAAARFRRQLKRLKPRIICFTGKDVFRHFAGLKRVAPVEYGLAGRYGESLVFVAPFPSHKWMTDEEKARHYAEMRGLLAGRLPKRVASVKVGNRDGSSR
ncbi:MAG: mismatch-specific DNA-glycosylase [Pyrinomonadaceae bacterium]